MSSIKRASIVHIINDNQDFDEVHDCGVDLASHMMGKNGVNSDIKGGNATSSDEEVISSGSSSKDEDESDEIVQLKTR